VDAVEEKGWVRGDGQPEIGHVELLKALAHETRLQILGILSYRDLSPAELARQRAEPVSKVAYHFRMLEELGYARVARTRRVRGSVEHFYRRTGVVVFEEDAWSELPPEVREVVTGTATKELIGRMARAISAGTFDSRLDRHFTWRAVALDDRGWEEMTSALNATFEEVSAIEARAAARLKENEGEPVLATVALTGFESPTD
jgi:DNA-binding transcriptional ArsR family regulator